MRPTLLALLLLAFALPSQAREARILAVRTAPSAPVSASVAGEPAAAAVMSLPGGLSSTGGLSAKAPTLNCEYDGAMDPAGTLILDPKDMAGTIFTPVDGADSLDVVTVGFGVFHFVDQGGTPLTFPHTMAVDLYHRISETDYGFVVGLDVEIASDPGVTGDWYDVDVSDLFLRTGPELMVLVGDLNPTKTAYLIPAGDASQRCLTGTNYCSVILSFADQLLYLYGYADANACPTAPNNVLLFDVAMEVEVNTLVPTRTLGVGRFKAGYER